MIDNRSDKVKKICSDHVDNGCRSSCPLAESCNMKPKETKEIFDARMNRAAEEIFYPRPSCYGRKLGSEACFHNCPVSDECYEVIKNEKV